jgi:RNA ligase
MITEPLPDALAAAVTQGAVFATRAPHLPLTLYCYTRRCMYEGPWTPVTMAARGLVLSDDGEIVCSPMPKFFNLSEPRVPSYPLEALEAEPVVVLEKLDGTLINVWHYAGFWQLTTKGGFTSPQVALASGVIASQYGQSFFSALDPAYTYGFELIHPDNRIIVNYGARSELVLLSVRHTATSEELPWEAIQGIARLAGVPVPQTCADMSPRNLRLSETGFEEGIVAWFPRLGYRVKAKRPEYLQAHRVLSGLGPRMILDLMEAQRLESSQRRYNSVPESTVENCTTRPVEKCTTPVR